MMLSMTCWQNTFEIGVGNDQQIFDHVTKRQMMRYGDITSDRAQWPSGLNLQF
jgi:fumarylacetoacetate (FAA) hydrolase family protein